MSLSSKSITSAISQVSDEQKKTPEAFTRDEIKMVLQKLGLKPSPKQVIDATISSCMPSTFDPSSNHFTEAKLTHWLMETPVLRIGEPTVFEAGLRMNRSKQRYLSQSVDFARMRSITSMCKDAPTPVDEQSPVKLDNSTSFSSPKRFAEESTIAKGDSV